LPVPVVPRPLSALRFETAAGSEQILPGDLCPKNSTLSPKIQHAAGHDFHHGKRSSIEKIPDLRTTLHNTAGPEISPENFTRNFRTHEFNGPEHRAVICTVSPS
tara:strand:- start:5577 stop:5888 length:312 start_codon:yes stop_codon:yes gene_type:complete